MTYFSFKFYGCHGRHGGHGGHGGQVGCVTRIHVQRVYTCGNILDMCSV